MVFGRIDSTRWCAETEQLYQLIRKPLYTIDADGSIVHHNGQLPFFCQMIMNKTPSLCEACRRGEVRKMKADTICAYRCHAGLDNVALPIMRDGSPYGALVIPALRNSKPCDMIRLAQQTGITQEELRAYFYKISLTDETTKMMYAKIFGAIRTLLPAYTFEAKRHAMRMAEMKILIELQEIALSKNTLRETLSAITELLVQHLRLVDCSLRTDKRVACFDHTQERLRQAETTLQTHVKKTKTPLVVDNLMHETLTAHHDDLPHLATAVFPLAIHPLGFGTLHMYTSSRSEIDRHFQLLTRTADVVASCIVNATLKKEAIESAITDPLTGLYNKRYFVAALEQEIKRAAQYERPVTLMMIDIDNFKSYNDSFGHPAGDNLLADIARIMKSTLGQIEILCRYGGEEFAVILPEASLHYACATAKRLLMAVSGHDFANRKVTISVGLCCATTGSTNAAQLVQDADTALYEAKHLGKNQVVAKARVNEHMGVVEAT